MMLGVGLTRSGQSSRSRRGKTYKWLLRSWPRRLVFKAISSWLLLICSSMGSSSQSQSDSVFRSRPERLRDRRHFGLFLTFGQLGLPISDPENLGIINQYRVMLFFQSKFNPFPSFLIRIQYVSSKLFNFLSKGHGRPFKQHKAQGHTFASQYRVQHIVESSGHCFHCLSFGYGIN
jgi:hypothetical protein